jgi:phosphoketolase
MKGINKDCNKRSMRVRKLYDTRNQQESITENLNAQSNEWVKERYEKRMRDDITASSQALFSSALNLQESGCKHTSNNLVTKRCHTRAEIIRKYLSCDQYGNRNCIRRTAVRIRQPKKKRNVGVQDLVDKGFEISCVSDISLETSITSY